jgi:hypothetical protein
MAAGTLTSIHIMRGGKILEIRSVREAQFPPLAKRHDAPKLAVTGKDAPPYGIPQQ